MKLELGGIPVLCSVVGRTLEHSFDTAPLISDKIGSYKVRGG